MCPDLYSDSYANLVFWSQSELSTFVDQALKRLSRMSPLFVLRSTSISTANGTATYTLPTRHIATLRVTVAGVPQVASSLHELGMLDATPETTSGSPTRFYQDKITQDKIGFYKVPTGVATVGLTYAEYHEDLDQAGNTTIAAPNVLCDYIETSALAEAKNKESDGATPEVSQHLAQHIGLIDAVIKDLWGEI